MKLFYRLIEMHDKNPSPESISLKMCRGYLGKKVKIIIDQPYGSYYEGTRFELNYGFVPDTTAPDGEGLDAYFLNSQKPLKEAEGLCIAIAHRLGDDDDKLIIVQEKDSNFTDEQIDKLINFREKNFKHIIIR